MGREAERRVDRHSQVCTSMGPAQLGPEAASSLSTSADALRQVSSGNSKYRDLSFINKLEEHRWGGGREFTLNMRVSSFFFLLFFSPGG